MGKVAVILLAVSLLIGNAQGTSLKALESVAERSGFKTTGRYQEVELLCREYAAAWPDAVRCTEFGRTPEGRPMLALVVSRSGALTPEDARARGIPVMLVQGGIHAHEVDGKDAGFLAVRQLLAGKAAPRALDSFVLVFVPVFNVDGHERFGPWNRPNQNGPEQVGWVTTARNVNLNRDYSKADAPEMQAMLGLLNAWDPLLYVDVHITNGAQYQYDVANIAEPIYVGDPALHTTGRALNRELNAMLAAKGFLPIDFYPDFVVPDDPMSGIHVLADGARYSTGYWALRNRFGLLVEAHAWKDYASRVGVVRDAILALSDMMMRRGRAWRALASAADERAASLAGQDIPVSYENSPRFTPFDFRGYAYSREPSALSGALATRFDPRRPQIWRLPLFKDVVPKISVRVPQGGYVVPPAHAAWVAERLAAHGIRFERVEKPLHGASVETFRANTATLARTSVDGRTGMELAGQWQQDKRDVPKGSLFVPSAQPKARLLVALFDPLSPDSYAAWGFFNSAFERRGAMEPYVAEQVATAMLDVDPDLAAEFKKRLAEDPAFARDPSARLEFFHRRHPSWDERHNLYPVYRTEVPLH